MSDSEPLYTIDNYRQEESIGFLLSQVKLRLTQAIDEELVGLGITTAQWVVLKEVATDDGHSASALCRNLGCDTGSMTRMLDRLQEKGLVQRRRSTSDRRVVELELTEAGRALLPQVVPVAVKVLNQTLTGFSRDELDLAKTLLRRMLANADARRGAQED